MKNRKAGKYLTTQIWSPNTTETRFGQDCASKSCIACFVGMFVRLPILQQYLPGYIYLLLAVNMCIFMYVIHVHYLATLQVK